MMPAQPARAPTWFFGDGPTLPSASASSPPPASAENGDGERPALKRSESRVAWQSASGRTSAALALSRMAHTVRGATLAKRLCRIPMDTVCAGSGKRPCPKAAERKVSPGADVDLTRADDDLGSQVGRGTAKAEWHARDEALDRTRKQKLEALERRCAPMIILPAC